MTEDFWLRFWGVRGSLATPGTETCRYGGETCCIEVRAGDAVFVVDLGSGARRLGLELAKEKLKSLNVLLTHTHMDHICGMPFFKPVYLPDVPVTVWAGHLQEGEGLESTIYRFMSPPVFPVDAAKLAGVEFRDFKGGEDVPASGGLRISTITLNHPDGACGYRFDFKGRSICIITDHELGNDAIDTRLEAFVSNADVMVHDATLTDDEYVCFFGWGHSTWEQVVALAKRARVKTPVLYHHDPRRTDDELDEIAAEAVRRHPGCIVAREGMKLRVKERVEELSLVK